MTILLYYDKEGLPITMHSWAMLMESDSYRTLAQDDALDGSFVATFWLGFNHNLGGTKKHLFETMVFNDRDRSNVLDSCRYTTKKEAIEGHTVKLKERNEAPKHHLRRLEP